jgi:hypothetical protein
MPDSYEDLARQFHECREAAELENPEMYSSIDTWDSLSPRDRALLARAFEIAEERNILRGL